MNIHQRFTARAGEKVQAGHDLKVSRVLTAFQRCLVVGFLAALTLVSALALQAQAPSSRKIPFNNVATTITCAPDPSPCQRNIILRMFDAATGGGQVGVDEPQTVSVDDPSGTGGTTSFVLGSTRPSGVDPNDFQSGSARFLDVLDAATLNSVLPARIELTAVAFAVNPGPQGPQGIQGPQGVQGPPGVVQSVSAGDASIVIGGSLAVPTVSVATNGITNSKVADGALSPAKVAGTAATLGSNNFIGDQNVSGHLIVGNPGGAAVDGIGLVGVRGNASAGGFAIVGSAPANGTAGQFNGSVNVTGPLSAGANLTTAGNLSASGNLRVEGGISASSAGVFDVDAPFVNGGRLRVAVNGNVGIGTASPTSKLDVAGDVTVRGLLQFGTHYIESAVVTIAPGFAGTAVARCSAGEVVLSGGFVTTGGRLLEATWTSGRDGWGLLAGNDGSANITIKATAVCARIPLPDSIP